MRYLGKRVLALALAVIMTVTSVGTSVYAYEAEKENYLSVTDKDGNEIQEDESWEERFPNGTFAFKNDSLTMKEEKEAKEKKITLYRLGGTKGKATAKIALTPAVAALDEEETEFVYANAASNRDFTVKVENPIGSDGTIGKKELESSYEIKTESNGAHTILSLKGVEGEYVRYFWHVKENDVWEPVAEEGKETLEVTAEEFASKEYMCVVEADYELHVSHSTTGKEKVWVNVNSRHITSDAAYEKNTYTDVTLDTAMPYKTSFLQVDFEEGEWVKDVVVKAVDDKEHEAEEIAILTIYEVEGAEFTESANRFSMCIRDDEEVLESSMGFALSEVRVDKSTGKVKVKVTRTGATQYVSSVDYETVEGTAKAGKDYAKADSTVAFSGGIDTQEIEIDLLDDKKKTSEDKYFTIRLKNAKGGTVKKGADEIRVNLFNTNTADRDNVATASKSRAAKDASSRVEEGKKAVTQNDNKVKVSAVENTEQKINLEPVDEEDGDMTGQEDSNFTYNLQLKKNQGSWNERESLNQVSSFYRVNGDSKVSDATPDSTLLDTQRQDNAYYRIPGLCNRFSTLSGKLKFKTSYSLYWAREYYSGVLMSIGTSSFAKSLSNYTSSSGDDKMADEISSQRSKATYNIYSQYGDKSNTKNIDVNLNYIRATGSADHLVFKSFVSKRGDTVRDRHTKVTVENTLRLKRRVLGQDVKINVVTPDNTRLSELAKHNNTIGNESRALIRDIQPTIEMGSGGSMLSNRTRKLFMGSSFNVAESGTNGVYKLDKVSLKANGKEVYSKKPYKGKTTVAFEKGSDRLDLNAAYSIDFEYNRYQKIQINCATSMLDTDTTSDRNDKMNLIKSKVRVNGSAIEWETKEDAYQHTSKSNQKNIKTINFGLGEGTKILYDDKVYEGSDNIPIADGDFDSSLLSFSVYTADAVSVVRDPEILGEKKVSLFEDRNNDGKYTPAGDGYEPFLVLEAGQPYSITNFRKRNNHNVVIQVEYAMQPASINVPPGATGNETFSVVPGFVTTVTSEEGKSKLSKEMKGYRDIASKDGTAKMYGRITSGSVSFLAGNDNSPAKMNEETGKYEWRPDWDGNLRADFDNPEKIKVYETKMPNGFKAATTKSQINEYLGCMHGNDTYVLTSRVPSSTGEKITATTKGGFYTIPEPPAMGFEADETGEATAPDDKDGVTSNQPDVADTKPSVDLPGLKVGLGHGSFFMEGDEIGFSVGTPIFGASKETDKKGEQDVMGKNAMKDMKDAMTNTDDNIFKQLRDPMNKRKHNSGNANQGSQGSATPTKDKPGKGSGSIDIAMNASFIWKYNKKTGNYDFSSAMVAVSIEGSLRFQYRFQCCPIFYVYVQVGLGLEAQTGLEVDKVEVKNGDGTSSIYNEVTFAGIKLNPSAYVEAGAGVGVDLAKLEVYVKVSVSFAFTLGEESQVDEFITQAAVGFRAVFLFFSYEMDLIGCKAGYDASRKEEGKKPWFFSWQVVGMDMGGTAGEEVESSVNGAAVTLSKPKSRYRLQNINSSDDNAGGDMSAQAYDVAGIDEFQVSGYGNNTSAVELASGFDNASDFQLLTVGDANYVLYTISRKNPTHSIHTTQLVMSKLSTTASTPEGGDLTAAEVMGLVNPIDASSSTKYIVVDRVDGADDVTGDLDYDAVVEDGKIKVTWTSYSPEAADSIPENLDSQSMLEKASQMLQVKTAEFDTNHPAAFTDAEVLTTGNGYRFLPLATTSDVHFYVDTKAYTEEEMTERENGYREKYEADAEGNNDESTGGTGDPYAKANYQYALTTDYLYGKYSRLHYSVKQEDGSYETFDVKPTKEWKDQGTRMDNIQMMEGKDDNYYITYTTSQKGTYGKDKEYATIKKLYVQEASVQMVDVETTIVETSGIETGTVEKRGMKLKQPVLLKTLVDFEESDDMDGVYVDGALTEAAESPTFTDLKIMKGKLSSETQVETFVLYNMNGITYVLDQENLTNALSSDTAPIRVKPLFEVNKEEGSAQSEATIGVDGDGNISAVYTQTVANTVNNALYVTKYDPTTKGFGKAFMLAMNQMQVYEDCVSQNLSAQETKEAFYQKQSDGTVHKFIFNSPQIALGKPTTENKSGTLTILTKGTLTKLVEATIEIDGESRKEYVPDTTDGSMDGNAGIYAISYGVGKQKIGETSITFDRKNFVGGATLYGHISFRNTGDVAIRASKANPATITMKIATDSGVSELAKWQIESNVLAGQQVITDNLETSALPTDVDTGVIYFEIQEDPTYSNAPLISSIEEEEGTGKITVGKKAELSIDSMEIRPGDTIEEKTVNGIPCAIADVEIKVSNRGVKDAENVKFSMKRSDGKNSENEEKYIPLEMQGDLVVDADGRTLIGNGDDQGIFDFVSYTDEAKGTVSAGNKIPAGTQRTIKGRIMMPMTAFDTEDSVGAANLQVTLTSDAEEYEQKNNSHTAKFIPATRFECIDNVSLTVGNPINFKLSLQKAMDITKRSNITLTEMQVSSNGEMVVATDKLLASAAYNTRNGYVTVTAAKEGSGILRIADASTSSFKDIAFVSSKSGCNICTESPVFDFVAKADGGTTWENKDVGTVHQGTILPKNSDICIGKEGGSFSFTTYARSIDLYYSGKIRVSSNNSFGFTAKEYNSDNGVEDGHYYKCQTIDFGNTELKKHTVTIKVLSKTASFDSMVEYYADRSEENEGMDIEEDTKAPSIILGKSLPSESTHLKPGTVLEIPVYAYDDVMLNSVSINGSGAEENINNQFAKGVMRVRKNGTYHIILQDSSGNIAQEQVKISCFENAGEKVSDTTDAWPEVSVKLVDENEKEITTHTNSNAYIGYEIHAEQKVKKIEVSKIDMLTKETTSIGDPVEIREDKTVLKDKYGVNLNENGYYEIKVTDAKGDVTKVIHYVDLLSRGPEVSLYVANHATRELFYCAGDEENQIELSKMVIYPGVVDADAADSNLEVSGKTPLLTQNYSKDMMDSGTIQLDADITSRKFTIFASDVSGKVTHYVYSDATCLNNLVVGNAEDLAYGIELNTEFKPYQRDYMVHIPYGYPETKVPEVNVFADETATVTKLWNEDVLTIKVKKGKVENQYTITLDRELCTCDTQLDVDAGTITIPKGESQAIETIRVNADVIPCEVHKDHIVENLKYRYRLVDAGYELLQEEEPEEETPDVESGRVETAETETTETETTETEKIKEEIPWTDTVQIETVQVETSGFGITFGENTSIRLEGDKIIAGRIPEGTRPVYLRVCVTAESDSKTVDKIVTYTLCNQYDVGLYITPGGQVSCGEDTVMAMEESETESPSVETGVILQETDQALMYDMSTGSEMEFEATSKEGYQFVGWYNAKKECISTRRVILYRVGKDDNIRALFKDVVDPTGSVTLTDKRGTNNTMATDEGEILVSPEGFDVEIQAADGQSGVKLIAYQIVKKGETYDPEGTWTPWNLEPLEITEEMDFVLYVKITDKDGNEIVVQSPRAMVEKSYAGIRAVPNFVKDVFTNKKDASIAVEVQKGTAELKSVTYQVGEKTYSATGTNFEIGNLPDGIYDVKITATDMFGKEVSTTIPVKKDTELPVLTISGIPEGKMVEQLALSIQTDGGLSGVKELRVNEKVWEQSTYPVTENGTYVFTLENKAGSVVTQTVEITCIAKPTPVPTPNATEDPASTPENPSASVTPVNPGADANQPAEDTGKPSADSLTGVSKKKEVAVTKITAPSSMKVGKETTEKISWKAIPSEADQSGVTFKSNNPSIATVDADGNVYGKKFGKTQIVIRSKSNPNVKKKVAVTVTLPKTKEIRQESTGKKGVRVVWKGVKEAVSYKVYRSKKSNGRYKLVAQVKQSIYTSKKKNADKYYYKVVAVAKNRAYNSDYSNYCTMVQLPPAPANVSGDAAKVEKPSGKIKKVKAKAVKGKINVSWKTYKKASAYIVYRAESEHGIFDAYQVVEKAKLKDTCVVKGKKYYYKVRAITYKKGEPKAVSDITKQIHVKAK